MVGPSIVDTVVITVDIVHRIIMHHQLLVGPCITVVVLMAGMDIIIPADTITTVGIIINSSNMGIIATVGIMPRDVIQVRDIAMVGTGVVQA